MRGVRLGPRSTIPRLAVCAAAALAAGLLACAHQPPPAPPPPAEPEPPPPAAACERIERIVVRKTERVLVAACEGGAELRLPVALARATGPKRARGDQRMPEGDYRIAGPVRPSQRFHRFLPIDYPALADADRALAEGRIGRAEHAAIARAHREGRLPPQETALGGHLGFHGEGRRWRGSGALDWTEGCVALSDADMERLGALAAPGTPVRIEP
jgi:murein L,D-transpeptidase YafK